MSGADDRLGDAIRKLASGLVECGKGSCRVTVELPESIAQFELRLIRTAPKRLRDAKRVPRGGRSGGLRRVGGVLVIDPKKRSAPSA